MKFVTYRPNMLWVVNQLITSRSIIAYRVLPQAIQIVVVLPFSTSLVN